MPRHLYGQLLRRLAKAFKRSSESISSHHDGLPPPIPSRMSRVERNLHKRSATCTDTPEWLSEPITATSCVPLRTPILSPSTSSINTYSTKSPTSASWKKSTFGKTADAARRRLSKSPSQIHLQRNDSVMSFASADAFGKTDIFDEDGGNDHTIPCSPKQRFNTSSCRRTRSHTDTSNYSLPTSFNYQTPPLTPAGYNPSHRTKNSESSIYTEDTLESEILMTCQMVDSAYQAVKSRPSSLIRIRNSFSDERSAYGRQPVWI